MEVLLSPHAKEVMDDRGVVYADVRTAVLVPEVSYSGDKTRHPKEYRVHQRGEIAVVVKPRGHDVEVVTVLWRTEHRWTDDEMKEHRQP